MMLQEDLYYCTQLITKYLVILLTHVLTECVTIGSIIYLLAQLLAQLTAGGMALPATFLSLAHFPDSDFHTRALVNTFWSFSLVFSMAAAAAPAMLVEGVCLEVYESLQET